jgi:hypothetical protein
VTTIKAIETKYAGCRFRSRLEARWAVFFNAMGIAWEYEPEGFVVDGRPYLPDFLLPESRTWVEVKGSEIALDRGLMSRAVWSLPRPSSGGSLPPVLLLLGPIPQIRPDAVELGWAGMGDVSDFSYGFAEYPRTKRLTWLGADQRQGPLTPLEYGRREGPTAEHMRCLRSYGAARSARFEHGERPAA